MKKFCGVVLGCVMLYLVYRKALTEFDDILEGGE